MRFSRIVDWLDERAGVRALWRRAADEPVPGGARLTYVFGSVLVYLFVQQVVLGVALAAYYSPSATDAWASVAYIQDQVRAGWFLRGLHSHGASAMVIVLVLHLAQVVWYGAYRRPRELNWWTGLAMGGLVFGFALTGYLLPWDQKGYWATQVATGILGGVPGGEPLRILLQGGHAYGNLTVTRFFTLHVFVLPGLLLLLLVAHVALFRRHGVTPPPQMSQRELAARSQRFVPHQLFYDVLAMAVVGAVLVFWTFRTGGAELFAPAQPASNFPARPEWYFLFLFQLLKYFEGPLVLVGTVVIPGAVAALLVALPFLDRAQSRRPRERVPVLAAVGAVFAGTVALGGAAALEDAGNEDFQESLSRARVEAERARELARKGVPPAGGEAVFENDPDFAARKLYREHCAGCHGRFFEGGDEAPALADFGSRAWLSGLVRNPRAPRYFGNTKHGDMEPYGPDDLPDDRLAAVVEFIVGTMGDEIVPAADPALAERGRELWEDELECNSCHEVEPGVSGDAPNLHGHGTVAWIAGLIANPGDPLYFGETAQMPPFGEKLGKEEIEALARLVASTRAKGAAAEAVSGTLPGAGGADESPGPARRP